MLRGFVLNVVADAGSDMIDFFFFLIIFQKEKHQLLSIICLLLSLQKKLKYYRYVLIRTMIDTYTSHAYYMHVLYANQHIDDIHENSMMANTQVPNNSSSVSRNRICSVNMVQSPCKLDFGSFSGEYRRSCRVAKFLLKQFRLYNIYSTHVSQFPRIFWCYSVENNANLRWFFGVSEGVAFGSLRQLCPRLNLKN